jgi:hypothetical protein
MLKDDIVSTHILFPVIRISIYAARDSMNQLQPYYKSQGIHHVALQQAASKVPP